MAPPRDVKEEISTRVGQLLIQMGPLTGTITFPESMRHHFDPRSDVTISTIYGFSRSHGHKLGIKSLNPTKMTLGTYPKLLDIFWSLEIWRIRMPRCYFYQVFIIMGVRCSDSNAKNQEIKAKIQDKFNYSGNCKVKIGIIPEPGGEFKVCVTSFLRWAFWG